MGRRPPNLTFCVLGMSMEAQRAPITVVFLPLVLCGWVQDTWRDVPYDWASLMENVLDASHVPFTHHK